MPNQAPHTDSLTRRLSSTVRSRLMKGIKLLMLIVLPITLVSCGFTISDERSFKNSDQEHMDRLMKLLDQRGVPYDYSDGMIRYKSSVKEEFEKAERAFDSTTSVQFVDSEVRRYFHNLLDTEGIEYLELDRDGGTWTVWWPESEDRKIKILHQVVEYKFSLMQKEASDCENESSEAPSSHSINQDALNTRAF